MATDYLYDRNNNDVAGQGAFSLFCQLHPDVSSVHRFVPLVQNYANVDWSFAASVSEPRASICDATDRWQGVYSTAIGIPDEGRNTSQDQLTFKDKVNRRVSARKYGVHKVHILGDKDVAFGDLALLGPAVHSPDPRKVSIDQKNPYVGVYPVKRRTLFFPRVDELAAVAGASTKASAQALCVKYCPWTRIPALAFAFHRDREKKVSDYKADYYDAAIGKADRDVYEHALAEEWKQVENMKTSEAFALYQWMMVSQMIGVFMSPGSAKSYAQILLM